MESPEQSSQIRERLVVLRAREGDGEAFRELVDAYDRRLLYYTLRFVDDPDGAADILQNVWLDVFRLLPRLQAPEAFRVWVYRITRNKVVDFLRSQRRHQELSVDLKTENPPQDEGDDLEFENAELVHRALAELSLPHRDVLTLRFLEDMSLAEIAEVLDCKLGSVKSRLHYAKSAFREVVRRILK